MEAQKDGNKRRSPTTSTQVALTVNVTVPVGTVPNEALPDPSADYVASALNHHAEIDDPFRTSFASAPLAGPLHFVPLVAVSHNVTSDSLPDHDASSCNHLTDMIDSPRTSFASALPAGPLHLVPAIESSHAMVVANPHGFDLDLLEALLDLHDSGEPVTWPHGADQLVARQLTSRAAHNARS